MLSKVILLLMAVSLVICWYVDFYTAAEAASDVNIYVGQTPRFNVSFPYKEKSFVLILLLSQLLYIYLAKSNAKRSCD